MKILHTYCLNYNIGDYALGIGVKNLLRHYLDVDLIAETNIQGTVFNDYFINEVLNKKYDLLIIGGGGIIHGAHWPNGWFWLIDKDNISKINIPFVVYGVGYNYFKGEKEIPRHGIEHLKETIKYSRYFSLRNDGSVERFQNQVGISLPEVPDPGFHVNLNTEYNKPIDEKYVVIQLADDKSEYRYRNSERKQKFIQSLKNIVRRLTKDYKVILAPHVFEDIQLCNTISTGMKNCDVWQFSKYAFDNAHAAISFYKYAEFVLAMRGHGQILPIGFNIPTVSLENHEKNKGLMQKLGLIEYNVDVLDLDFEIKLNKIIDKLEVNRNDIISHYQKRNLQMNNESKNAFRQIRDLIN